MIVGVLTVDLAILDAQSLKDKRRIIQGVKQRLRNRFNVTVAEVEYANTPKRCRLGIAVVSNETRFVHAVLDKVVDTMRGVTGLTLVDYERWLC